MTGGSDPGASGAISSRAVQGRSAEGAQPRVELISDRQQAAAWRSDWNRLADAMPKLGPFGRWEWFDCAWPWAALDGRPVVLRVHDGERTLGLIALLHTATGPRRLRLRGWTFLAVPDTQFNGIIAPPESMAAVADAFARWLRRCPWRWWRLDLERIPAEGGEAELLAAALRRHGMPVREEHAGDNFGIFPDGAWEGYYGGLSRRLKKGNNLVANRLKRAGDVELRWLTGEQVDEHAAAALAELSARSWKSATTATSLDQPGPREFYAALVEHGRRDGWLSVWQLWLDDKLLATELQIYFGNVVYALRSDFEPDAADLSPGTYANWQVIRSLYDLPVRAYYFGPGENAYKKRWTQSGAPLRRITAYPSHPLGQALGSMETRVLPWLRSRLPRRG